MRPPDKDRKKDFPEALKRLLEAGTIWDAKIRAIKSAAAGDPQTRVEFTDFRYVLQDAEVALKSTLDLARKYSDEPEPGTK